MTTCMQPAAQAAATVAQVQWGYARNARSLAQAALAGAAQFVEWAHYPRNDCADARHGTRFYYHAHAAADRAAHEHGHFHLFVPADSTAAPFSHLAGLSLNAQGLPLRWFTTNQWVTGEHWVPATALVAALARFELQVAGRLAPVARWLSAMVHLYADEITTCLHERDTLLEQHARRTRLDLTAALQDRQLHIVSQRPVNLLPRLLAAGTDTLAPGEEP